MKILQCDAKAEKRICGHCKVFFSGSFTKDIFNPAALFVHVMTGSKLGRSHCGIQLVLFLCPRNIVSTCMFLPSPHLCLISAGFFYNVYVYWD